MFYSLNDTYWGLQIFLTLILLFKVFASSATMLEAVVVVYLLPVCI